MNPQRSIRVAGDLNLNVPNDETARVVGNMSARGQQSFAAAALRNQMGGSNTGSNAGSNAGSYGGRSSAPSGRTGASRAGMSSIGRDLITGEPGGSRSGMSQITSGSRGGGSNMNAMALAAEMDRRSNSQRSASASNQAGLYSSQRAPSYASSSRQVAPYNDNQRAPSNASSNNQMVPYAGNQQTPAQASSQMVRPAAPVAVAAPQAALPAIVEGSYPAHNILVVRPPIVPVYYRRPRRIRSYYYPDDEWYY